ncbi:MAG: hypothetical protein JSW68_04215 [Burkholderiales bacterium]|nr:MAG: hypothetical protein JSW68_04215 [Burkholderiales bacterium]
MHGHDPGSDAARLHRFALEAARLRKRAADDRALGARVRAVKQWQSRRLARTHADLLEDRRYGRAARFFLDEIYGAKDFTQRDAELQRIVPMLSRLLPHEALAAIADAVELDALSERLDTWVAESLDEPEAARIDEARYAAAYLAVGDRNDRVRQIDLVVDVGYQLDGLVRHPLVGKLLAAMRLPARAAGLGEMQRFLQDGFRAFEGMGGASEFLERIAARERALNDSLLAGRS